MRLKTKRARWKWSVWAEMSRISLVSPCLIWNEIRSARNRRASSLNCLLNPRVDRECSLMIRMLNAKNYDRLKLKQKFIIKVNIRLGSLLGRMRRKWSRYTRNSKSSWPPVARRNRASIMKLIRGNCRGRRQLRLLNINSGLKLLQYLTINGPLSPFKNRNKLKRIIYCRLFKKSINSSQLNQSNRNWYTYRRSKFLMKIQAKAVPSWLPDKNSIIINR